jgi:hypothetical protein
MDPLEQHKVVKINTTIKFEMTDSYRKSQAFL